MVDAVPYKGSLLKYCACPGPSELPTIDFAPNSDVLLKSGEKQRSWKTKTFGPPKYSLAAGASCLGYAHVFAWRSSKSRALRIDSRVLATATGVATAVEEAVEEGTVAVKRPQLRLQRDDAGNIQKLTIAQTAADAEKTPQELDLWELLDVQPDHFARTTPDKHKEIVHEMWQRCLDNGDIYKTFSATCKNPDFILPSSRRSQVLVWLEEDNKRDFSISRASTSWGIPVPGDDSQVIYVWFDALLGYLSSLLRPEDPATLDTVLERGWPADVHVIGKDIMRFHTMYWPAMLMSAKLPLPKHICTHGFLTKDGMKMGKSLGNVVEPVPLVKEFGADAVRFFFGSCLSFGLDGDFSYETFIKRVNSSLANELGNLVHRILTLLRKNLPEPTSPTDLVESPSEFDDHPVRVAATKAPATVATCYEQVDIPKAVATALEIASVANVRMNEVEPWAKLKKTTSAEDKNLAIRELLVMAEGVRICAVLLSPVTPGLSANIFAEFGLEPEGLTCTESVLSIWSHTGQLSWERTKWSWDVMPGLVGPKPKPLFQRIDLEPWQGK
eukprot:g12036.t1